MSLNGDGVNDPFGCCCSPTCSFFLLTLFLSLLCASLLAEQSRAEPEEEQEQEQSVLKSILGTMNFPAAESSAAAFVQGGVQDACDDSCSICLEPFAASNPVTVTSCKHEYHLQCILEWAQRSKDCPMCWQPLSLKDPSSQELLDAVEQESRQIASVFHRPLDEFEFHVPAYADDSDFEERIMQHLAAAAMGRAHHFARRGNIRNRSSSGQGHPQFVVVPAHASSFPALLTGDNVGGNLPTLVTSGSVSSPVPIVPQDPSTPNGSLRTNNFVRAGDLNRLEACSFRQRVGLEPIQEGQQRTGHSEFHSFSESLKSRFVAASSRYKETFTKATKGFREKLKARTNTTDIETLRACTNMTNLGAHAREIAGVGELQGNTGGTNTNANVTCVQNRIAPQPVNDETRGGFEGSFSKDIEGSSGGGDGDAEHVALPSPA